MKDYKKEFGKRVRKQREITGMTQANLAYFTGLHRTYIAGIERGERNPSLKNILKIARELDITIYALLRDLE
ncbi:MAG: helix-turn-helix transcriptional regulator [Endomicrobiales bacterium]|nr:helix-turn-helix transcriptional regulator [Endomicrobiales bacterium]